MTDYTETHNNSAHNPLPSTSDSQQIPASLLALLRDSTLLVRDTGGVWHLGVALWDGKSGTMLLVSDLYVPDLHWTRWAEVLLLRDTAQLVWKQDELVKNIPTWPRHDHLVLSGLVDQLEQVIARAKYAEIGYGSTGSRRG